MRNKIKKQQDISDDTKAKISKRQRLDAWNKAAIFVPVFRS